MVSLEGVMDITKDFLTRALIVPELLLLLAGGCSGFIKKWSLKGADYLKNLRKTLLDDKKSGSDASEERQKVEIVPDEDKGVPLSRIKEATGNKSSAA